MATHEQSHLGPVFLELALDGYLTIPDDSNEYEVAAIFANKARDAGVYIDAEIACPDCGNADESRAALDEWLKSRPDQTSTPEPVA